MILKDRKYTIPRIWSNSELMKIAHLFSGKIVNVSAWQDKDKQGGFYKDYFLNANQYFKSNYEHDLRGFQGDQENEFFLDLEKEIPEKWINDFDVVFNHTTFEHIFDIFTAFKNLCLLSKDVVIFIVPFLQEMHGEYGDYWRFTPQAIHKLFELNNFKLIYINYSMNPKHSIYLFAVASKNPTNWDKIKNIETNKIDNLNIPLGKKHINNSIFYQIELYLRSKTEKIIKGKL